jgi:hypothetical protein
MRMRASVASLLIALSGAIVMTSSAAAGPAVATKWRDLGESQNDCLAHAAAALFKAGFDAGDLGSQSRSGRYGDYTASIRCVSDRRVVFFVLSGPEPTQVSRYLDILYTRF